MFNRARHNLYQFNRPQGTICVMLKTDAGEAVDGIFHITENIYLSAGSTEAVSARAAAAQGLLLCTEAVEAMGAKSDVIGVAFLLTNAQEAISAAAALGADVYLSSKMAEQVSASLNLGANVYLRMDAKEGMGAFLRLGANVHLGTAAYEIISAICDAEIIDVFVMMLDVALEPGDRLVIDSDHYTVLHNEESVLHKHTGDWVKLARNVRSLLVESGTPAQLTGETLYTERYL